ncbi:hypothetical protein VTN31DRAFT_1528 [Thermomyces dupontii]|uniref:uncharacterized protein n=1 Tax=Talaromyces thermophilus TaxID=28565 RepID=UPI0037420489
MLTPPFHQQHLQFPPRPKHLLLPPILLPLSHTPFPQLSPQRRQPPISYTPILKRQLRPRRHHPQPNMFQTARQRRRCIRPPIHGVSHHHRRLPRPFMIQIIHGVLDRAADTGVVLRCDDDVCVEGGDGGAPALGGFVLELSAWGVGQFRDGGFVENGEVEVGEVDAFKVNVVVDAL